MKGYKGRCLILMLAFLGGCSVNAYSSPHWDEFLKQPDKDSRVVLENAISESAQRCSWGNPNNHYVVPMEKRKQLFELIANGNESAFRVGLLVLRCLDGGELEDFYRSSGLFFETQTHTFLKIIKEKSVPESDIKYMLTMLPLDTVDNIDLAIHVVKNRIALLKGINEYPLEEIKKIGLSFLEKEGEALDRIKVEMGKAP